MRLIDADALLNRMQKDPLFDLVERYGVSGVIDAEPTVDAVPVIRCKDCKHWSKPHGWNGFCEHGIPAEADDFCSWAERKDNETD